MEDTFVSCMLDVRYQWYFPTLFNMFFFWCFWRSLRGKTQPAVRNLRWWRIFSTACALLFSFLLIKANFWKGKGFNLWTWCSGMNNSSKLWSIQEYKCNSWSVNFLMCKRVYRMLKLVRNGTILRKKQRVILVCLLLMMIFLQVLHI